MVVDKIWTAVGDTDQVQWVQGHNPDLIVLDDNGHEKEGLLFLKHIFGTPYMYIHTLIYIYMLGQ